MKTAFASAIECFFLFVLFLLGCTGPEKKGTVSMAGAYQMTSQSVKSDSTDTTYKNAQLKIYTDDHMMYANINPPDSVSGFGVASYRADGDTVTENIMYYAFDSIISTTPTTYKLDIKKTDKGFLQFIKGIENNAGQKFDLTEKYDSVGSGSRTPLDGAWKEVSIYWIKGKDTSKYTTTQYKTYFDGYVIWGNTSKDSLNKMHTGIGFGKYTMPAPNKVKESLIASTNYQVRGKDFDIDIEMLGSDRFRQTIHNQDSSKSVEEYERLKK